MTATPSRYLGPAVWNRRVAHLPASGTLLVATDLQGHRRDYDRMKSLLEDERARDPDAVLAFVGDLVHGPDDAMHTAPEAWPPWFGQPYRDASADILRDFERYTREAPAFSLLGNHEHAHVGGPVTSKFHDDEPAVLETALGDDVPAMLAFLRTWPLLAVAPCGAVLTHAAPRLTAPDLAAFERLEYAGYERVSIQRLHDFDPVGALLWARGATDTQARAFLAATSLDTRPNAFVAYGHDVVPAGWERVGDHQLCFSTSFGLVDGLKVYLRIDLARRYESVHDLVLGREILPLYL